MSNLQHVAEIVEHGGSLSVIRAAHPQFEIDALEVGAKIYIEAQVDLLQAENAKLRKVADAAAEYLGDWDGDNQLNNLEDALEEAGYKV